MNSTDIITEFLKLTAWRMEAPKILSAFHILAVLVLSSIAVIAAVTAARRYDDDTRIKILGVLGWVMLASELYKQLFYYFIVNGQTYDWWFFPFQLCSVPMYMCILLPLFYRGSHSDKSGKSGKRGKYAESCALSRKSGKYAESGGFGRVMLTFMCGFTFVSAVAALVWPEDMLRPYVTLTWHGLIWHSILLFISVMIALSGMADFTWKGFLKSVLLFLVLCAAAIMINVLAEPIAAANPIHPESAGSAGVITYPDMFYLSPYHASTQPVIKDIDAAFGRAAAMIAYIFMIIAAAGLVDFAFSKLNKKRR